MRQQVFTCFDDRINRDNNFGCFTRLANELVFNLTGDMRNLHGRTMNYDFFTASSYRNAEFRYQVDVDLYFDTHKAIITITR